MLVFITPDSSPAIAVIILNVEPGAYEFCIALSTNGLAVLSLYFAQFSLLIPPTKSSGL